MSQTDLYRLVKPGVSTRNDFPLIRAKSALLVVDVQDHLSADNVDSETDGAHYDYLFSQALPAAIPNISRLVQAVRSIRDGDEEGCGCEVVFTFLQALTSDRRDISLDYKLSGPSLTNIPNLSKAATFSSLPSVLHPSSANRGDIIVPKTSCSVFQSTNLHYILSNLGIQQLVVCGQLTDQCVMSAVRDAADLGYFVTVVEDACAATSSEEHERGLLGMQGFSRIVSSSQVLSELSSSSPCLDSDALHQTENLTGTGNESTNDFQQETIATKLEVQQAFQWKIAAESQAEGATAALIRSLHVAGVKFLRFAMVDTSNSIRVKAVPIKKLLSGGALSLDNQVSFAKVCLSGLPSYADAVIPESKIDARDLLVIKPDLNSLRIIPYSVNCNSAMVFGTLHDQRTGDLSEFCPRGLLTRVIETAKNVAGVGFTVGTEIEFCLVRSPSEASGGSSETIVPVDFSLFASTTTLNDQETFITDVYDYLEQQDIHIETVHAESASGQMEVVLPYTANIVALADDIVLTKETIKACAKKYGLRALFNPKVYDSQAGNGMHVHLSLRDEKSDDTTRNIFPGDAQFSISSIGQSFMEGILSHLKALLSFTMPTVNSFSRVGPGCWTGHQVSWGVEDKESSLRVCLNAGNRKATNVELKLMDCSCNPHLALAAILWSGLDGIVENMILRRPNIDASDNDEQSLPGSLEESLDQLCLDTLLINLLGQKLCTSYVAVKKAEIAHDRGLPPGADILNHLKK